MSLKQQGIASKNPVVTIDEIKESVYPLKKISIICNTLVSQINNDIKTAYESNLSSITFGIPRDLEISNLSKEDSTIEVVYTLIKWLEDKEYIVKVINNKGDKGIQLLISWNTDNLHTAFKKDKLNFIKSKMGKD